MINTSGNSPEPTRGQRTVGEIVASIRDEFTGVVQQQIEIAKAELTREGKKVGIAGAGFILALFFLLSAWITLLVAIGWGLQALGLPAWGAFLIVTAVLVLIAVICALIGYFKVKALKAPEKTIETTQGAINAVKGQGRSSRADYDSAFEELYGKQVPLDHPADRP